MNLQGVILVFASYLLGGVPTGLLLASLRGLDIRRLGSGNIGAANVARTTGVVAGVLTLVLDAAKGGLAVGLAGLAPATATTTDGLLAACAAVGVVAGHCWPVLLGFRGGKGVATMLGAMLVLSPWALPLPLLLFAAVAGLSRIVSLASIVGALALPAGSALAGDPAATIVASALLACVVIGRHHENIARLLSGTEKPLILSTSPRLHSS